MNSEKTQRTEWKDNAYILQRKIEEGESGIGAMLPQHSPSAMGRQKKWPPHNGSHLSMYQALASISGDDKIFRATGESIFIHFTIFGDGDAREVGATRENPCPNLRYR